MTRDILTTKAWFIFLAFLLFPFALAPLMNFFMHFINGEFVYVLTTVLVLAVYMAYPVLVGIRLRGLLLSQPLYKAKTNASLIVDCSLILAANFTSQLVQLQQDGPSILSAIASIVGLLALVRLGSFPAHEIRSIELKRNAGIWECVSETFQMMVWPLGVFWMQPRVNRIANKRSITISE